MSGSGRAKHYLNKNEHYAKILKTSLPIYLGETNFNLDSCESKTINSRNPGENFMAQNKLT